MRETLNRWLHENIADTREPDGPAGRCYTVAFARVWDEILGQIERRRGWKLSYLDEELGIITATCTSLVFRFVDDLTIWVELDENALTRVEALSRSRVGDFDLGVNRRRIARLFGSLDRTLGPGSRLVDRRVARRPSSGEPLSSRNHEIMVGATAKGEPGPETPQ